VPFPNWPEPLAPQAQTFPSAVNASEWEAPVETCPNAGGAKDGAAEFEAASASVGAALVAEPSGAFWGLAVAVGSGGLAAAGSAKAPIAATAAAAVAARSWESRRRGCLAGGLDAGRWGVGLGVTVGVAFQGGRAEKPAVDGRARRSAAVGPSGWSVELCHARGAEKRLAGRSRTIPNSGFGRIGRAAVAQPFRPAARVTVDAAASRPRAVTSGRFQVPGQSSGRGRRRLKVREGLAAALTIRWRFVSWCGTRLRRGPCSSRGSES
jgi:hypothetical protein